MSIVAFERQRRRNRLVRCAVAVGCALLLSGCVVYPAGGYYGPPRGYYHDYYR